MDDLIRRQDVIDAIYAQSDDDGMYAFTALELEQWIQALPSAEPNDKLKKIADLVDGTIDHFDLDDAMDLLYQIKDVCEKEMQ